MKKKTKVPPLPSELSEEYEVINWKGSHRQVFGRFGVVDLSKLTKKRAEKLIQSGFSKLRRKSKKAKEKE